MKKTLALVLALVLSLSLTSAFAAETISVMATYNPHAEVLELVKDKYDALGYNLDIIPVSDYVVENPATSAGDIQANYFQHLPYLAGYNASVTEAEQLVPVIYTHFEPMAIYAGTKTALDQIAEGDTIAIPNDPVNENRALLLLQDAGLIKLPESTTLESTCIPADIVENPYKLEFAELNAELIPSCANGADPKIAYAVINGNNATLIDLVPYVDGLYAEQPGSLAAESYVNVVVVKPENAEAQWVKDLETVIYTQEVYDLIVNAGFAPTFEVK